MQKKKTCAYHRNSITKNLSGFIYVYTYIYIYISGGHRLILLIYIKMAHLNSAEGIQNMCATQIMTKSKSLRTGFSSQVAH